MRGCHWGGWEGERVEPNVEGIPLTVRSLGVVIRWIAICGGMSFGPGFTRQRQNDRGNSSHDPLCQGSVRVLAARYGVSPTTVQKWKKRGFVTDTRMGRKAVDLWSSPWSRKPLALPSAVTRCCRLMTAFGPRSRC